MASWTLFAVLCSAICLAFVSYAEGQVSYPCNSREIAECKKPENAKGRTYKDCKHIFYQYDCNPACYYTNGSSNTVCSPDYQPCKINAYPWGECDYAKCACVWGNP